VYTDDFILRMINQAVAVLLQVAGLRQAKQYQQAQQAIDQSLEQLLGLRADLLKQLDDEVIFGMLTLQDRLDIERVVVIAELFKAEGDILADQNRLAESQQSYLRALNFYLEAGLSDQIASLPLRFAQQVEWLVNQSGILPLPDDIQWSLFNYYERFAEYAKAETTLTELASRPGVYADLQPEIIAFYQRLLKLPPADLDRVHLDREQVQEKLDRIGPPGNVG
jgi:tetratricopeptide (TPR) repeat protein